jgi:hypothetical protein
LIGGYGYSGSFGSMITGGGTGVGVTGTGSTDGGGNGGVGRVNTELVECCGAAVWLAAGEVSAAGSVGALYSLLPCSVALLSLDAWTLELRFCADSPECTIGKVTAKTVPLATRATTGKFRLRKPSNLFITIFYTSMSNT